MHRTLLLLALLVLPSLVQAAAVQGKQADYSMTLTINAEALAKSMQALGLPAPPKGQKQPELKIPPVTVSGKSQWSGARSRLEIRGKQGQLESVSIADLAKPVAYLLDPARKMAWKSDLSTNPVLAGALSKGSGSGAASMVTDYDDMLAKLKGVKGVKYKELTPKQVNGYDCRGVSYTIDLKQFRQQLATSPADAPDAQSQAMLSSILAAMDTLTGETWVSTKHKVAVKIISNMSGAKMVMELKNIKDWAGDDSSFAVPQGYSVKERPIAARGGSAH
jgi:hypothetical protein